MICYRDRTFCSRYAEKECINHNCGRAFTEIDRVAATKWWGNEDFPLCLGDCYTDKCDYIQAEDFLC